jgi:phage terminase large subunit-like protein
MVAPTAADVRDVMVEGESGILTISPPWFRPNYEPSKRRLTWPNGAIATTFSADEPERLRGPQGDLAWADELAAWRYLQASWDNMMFGLRLGENPRVAITTTPKPLKMLKEMVENDPTVAVTRGTTYDNVANLSPIYYKEIISKYEGTRHGLQEIYAKILDESEHALWTRELIERNRVVDHPELIFIVVAVDPPGGATECGIAVAGLGEDGHGYVLEDCSLKAKPDAWGKAAVIAYNKYGANFIFAEANYGGDMVENTIRTVAQDFGIMVPVEVGHVSRGKALRAEPVVALYEQGRVHHVGMFELMEGEMCTWEPPTLGKPSPSPNRLDAVVHAINKLMVGFVRQAGDYGITVAGSDRASASSRMPVTHGGVLCQGEGCKFCPKNS